MPSVALKIWQALVAVQIVAYSALMAAEYKTIAVEDQSTTGSPLAISGTVSYWEVVNRDRPAWATTGEDTLTYSHGEAVTGKNISSRPLLAVALSINFILPHGESWTQSVQYDYFFKDLLAPGGTLFISMPLGDSRSVIPLRSPETVEPHVAARVLYAQSADGTVFGDEEYGKKIVSLRGRALEMLRRIDQIYRTQGPKQFLDALKQPVEPHDASHTILELLLSTADQSGPASAEEKLQGMLAAATRHQGMLK